MSLKCPKIENWVNCLHISDQFLRTLCPADIKHGYTDIKPPGKPEDFV